MKKRAFVGLICAAFSAGVLADGVQSTTLNKTLKRQNPTGYSRIVEAPRELFTVRRMFPSVPDNYYDTDNPPVDDPIVSFAHLSDFQIVDDASPLRAPFLDQYVGTLPTDSSYRPQEMLSTQMADAVIRGIRKVGAGPASDVPLSMALITGDSSDNMQFNETRWYIGLLDGATITPRSDSGIESSPSGGNGYPDMYWAANQPWYNGAEYDGFPTYYTSQQGYGDLFTYARAPFKATGIGMPWYAALGNHDATVQGNMPKDYLDGIPGLPTLNEIATGTSRIVDLVGFNPTMFSDLDVSYSEFGSILKSFIANDLRTYSRPTDGSPDRRLLSRSQFMGEHFNTVGQPAGHGFVPGSSKAYYSFLGGANSQIKFIALDTTNTRDFGPGGWIDNEQAQWLEQELEANSKSYLNKSGVWVNRPTRENKLFVIYGHHTLETMDKVSMDDGIVDDSIPLGIDGEALKKLLLRFPNVVLYVSGHTHANAITPYTNGAHGFWQIATASTLDWPMQGRIIEMAVTADSSGPTGKAHLSIFTTMVDGDAPLIPGNTPSSIAGPQYLAALGRELAANDPQELARGPDSRRGYTTARNTQLVMPIPFILAAGGKPVASFGDSTDSPTRTTRLASTSTDADGTIISYKWTFPDGTTATGPSVTKTWPAYGRYPVKLEVTDNLYYRNEITRYVDVLDSNQRLDNGVSRTVSARTYQPTFFVEVPAGATNLKIELNEIPGYDYDWQDASLFVKRTTKPAYPNVFDCKSDTAETGNESCVIAQPQAGIWWVKVYDEASNVRRHVSVKASFTPPAAN